MNKGFTGKELGQTRSSEDIKMSLEHLTRDLAEKPITFQRKNEEQARQYTSEEDALQVLDPVLGQLHKDLKNMQEHYRTTRDVFGKDDAMLDVIADQVDSARSAYETRLLELKADRGIFVKISRLYKSPKDEAIEYEQRNRKELAQEKEREGWRLWTLLFHAKKRPAKNNDGEPPGWVIALFLIFFMAQRESKLSSAMKRI